ncbi:MAG: sulfatase [Alphaproteobacteria bacterium]
MTRPNFVLFITDQHRADHLGCYGNEIVKTPHIDGIAARGTRFDRFYVATPICMPNRATLMTGRMPSLHGARQNGIPLALSATTFVDLLAAAGYRTALIGKSHLQSMSPAAPEVGMPVPDPGLVQPPERLREADKSWPTDGRYDQELAPNWADPAHDLDLPYYGFQHVELCVNHGDKVVGHYSRWLAERRPDWKSLRGRENQLPGNEYVAPQAWRTAVPAELYPTAYIAERAEAYLEDRAARGDDAPFFLQCAFPDPHHPFTPPGRYWDMYDPADIKLPRSFDLPQGKLPAPLAHILKERADGKANRDGQRVIAVTEREAREATALTYGMITMIDDAVGRVLSALARAGLAENTVVIFTADHGDFMGDHQLMLKGALHYQSLVRVPFVWSDPAAARAASSEALCGTIDIAQTVLARAGVAAHNGNQGLDLASAAAGDAAAHDAMLIEEHQRRGYMGMDNNFRARSLITDRHRLTIYEGVTDGELYDLRDDPDELVNLWDAPAARALREDLMERLARKMMAMADSSPLATHHGP